MSNELQLVTTNSAADGWVDGTPGAVSTGYQAQNTVLQALFNGLDKSSVRISGANLIVDPSGVIDDSGLPFVVQSAITLALPTTGAANWYLKVVAGSTALERSIEFTDNRGTYDAAKNGFYNTGGERVLNWCYNRFSAQLVRLPDSDRLGGGDDMNIQLPYLSDLSYFAWQSKIQYAYYNPATTSVLGIAYKADTDQFLILKAVSIGIRSVDIINRNGTSGGSVAIGGTTQTLIAYDNTAGKMLIGEGGNTVKVYTGATTTLEDTLTVKAFRIGVDGSGNLLGCESGGTVVTRYTGLSDTELDTATVGQETHGLAWDTLNDNLLIVQEYGSDYFIEVCNGFTATRAFRLAYCSNASCKGICFDPLASHLYFTLGDYIYLHGQRRIVF
jgi:hypothetical protein